MEAPPDSLYLATTKNNISLASSPLSLLPSLSPPFQTSRSEKDCTPFPRCAQSPFHLPPMGTFLCREVHNKSDRLRNPSKGLPTSVSLLPYVR